MNVELVDADQHIAGSGVYGQFNGGIAIGVGLAQQPIGLHTIPQLLRRVM